MKCENKIVQYAKLNMFLQLFDGKMPFIVAKLQFFVNIQSIVIIIKKIKNYDKYIMNENLLIIYLLRKPS